MCLSCTFIWAHLKAHVWIRRETHFFSYSSSRESMFCIAFSMYVLFCTEIAIKPPCLLWWRGQLKKRKWEKGRKQDQHLHFSIWASHVCEPQTNLSPPLQTIQGECNDGLDLDQVRYLVIIPARTGEPRDWYNCHRLQVCQIESQVAGDLWV